MYLNIEQKGILNVFKIIFRSIMLLHMQLRMILHMFIVYDV